MPPRIDIGAIGRPCRAVHEPALLARDLRGILPCILPCEVDRPDVPQPIAVARHRDALAVRTETRLHVEHRAARQAPGGGRAAGDGNEVDVAEQVEHHLRAVGADVDVHPRALARIEGRASSSDPWDPRRPTSSPPAWRLDGHAWRRGRPPRGRRRARSGSCGSSTELLGGPCYFEAAGYTARMTGNDSAAASSHRPWSRRLLRWAAGSRSRSSSSSRPCRRRGGRRAVSPGRPAGVAQECAAERTAGC